MEDNQLSDIEQVCRKFIDAFSGILSWQWDGRFETMLAQFIIDEKAEIEKILNQFMNVTWNSGNVSEAPENVQDLISSLGGLMPGQFLLTTDPQMGALLYCAWWPWGDGRTVSIRVGPTINTLSSSDKEELLGILKNLVS